MFSPIMLVGKLSIEFNPTKSINTQARAAAMLKLILDEYGYLPSFNKEDFIQYHKKHIFY